MEGGVRGVGGVGRRGGRRRGGRRVAEMEEGTGGEVRWAAGDELGTREHGPKLKCGMRNAKGVCAAAGNRQQKGEKEKESESGR